MHGVAIALILIGITCAAALAQPRLRLPLPFVQILAGVAAAALGLHIDFDPHLFMLLFLPPLLFADGFATSQRELHRARWPLLGAAVGLVFATVLAGGYFLHWLIPALPLSVAFAIAAVVSPTDAVAISGIMAKMPAAPRLRHLLESEALLNDASGLVAFRFAIAATLTGTFSLPHAAGQFILIALGGLATGWLASLAFIRLVRLAPQHAESPVQVLLPALLPFGAYWLAEWLGVSGILAAVAAGIAASRQGLLERAQVGTRLNSVAMWRVLIFCFNGIVFVLLGTQLLAIAGPAPIGIDLTRSEARNAALPQIAALMAVLILVRFVWVIGSLLIERIARRRAFPGWREILAGSLAGARGAITLAGVLTIPQTVASGAPFPGRDLAITLASGVIVLSLLIAAVFLPWLLRHAPAEPDPIAAELRHAREIGATAALAALDTGAPLEGLSAIVADLYRRRLDALRTQSPAAAESATWATLHRAALTAERAAIERLRASRDIDDAASRALLAEIDLLEAALARPARA